ncbi:MAG: molybdopterin-dependent oxidoreductase [Alphaproteobacteria bacterium]|jgi:isoquinoline 1-oxidoreductase beta subunit|nr:molybdopterin-dependent oxidoreductase [Alphaproteobacteria bacterium]MDP6623498.1 molybdopterin-dependent oxidoreductase [Alphaproteobacteria bacterium]
MARAMNVSRRKFLIGGGLATGALVVGCSMRVGGKDRVALEATLVDGESALNAWLKIDTDGSVTVAVPRQEMGQGIYTALAMLVAEELEVDWQQVGVEQAPIADVYANTAILMEALPFDDDYHRGKSSMGARFIKIVAGMLGVQGTGGSTSVRDAWQPMRTAGAAAREMLIQAAAERWQVAAGQCRAAQGRIHHDASKRSLGYGELAAAATKLAAPTDPPLKPADQRRLIGHAVPRLDVAEKTDGRAIFAVDVRPPGLAYAAIKASPVFGGSLVSFDDGAVRSLPGVIAVVALPDAVAVVADSWWRAKQAVERLPAKFHDGGNGDLDTAAVFRTLERGLQDDDPDVYAEVGDVEATLTGASTPIEAVYRAPYLAHACMEPINCTARVDPDGVEVWVSSQGPTLVKWIAAKVADVDSKRVRVHTPYLGGGFGRRGETDMVIQAVTIAKTLPGKPIKLLWSREEDIQHDMYRPAAVSRFRATLSGGRVEAWHNRIVSQVPTKSFIERLLPWAAVDMPDNTTSQGAADIPYAFNHRRVEHVPVSLPVPAGYWRSVGHSHNAFFTESFLDELAHAAGRDPYEFRRELLDQKPDFRMVLDRLAKEADWGTPLAPGRSGDRGRGLALHQSFGSIVGQVAEVTLRERQLTVDRVVCVVDCGTVVHPDIVVSQIESGIIFGLTAAFFGEIELEKGRVVQRNFPDYEMVRLANAPRIETHLAPSGRHLGGIGEVGTPPIAPAVANAIFAAGGGRVRELPLAKAGFQA